MLLEVGLPATGFSLPGEGFCCFRGRAAAIGIGVGRGIAGCIAMTVAMSVAGGHGWCTSDKDGYC